MKIGKTLALKMYASNPNSRFSSLAFHADSGYGFTHKKIVSEKLNVIWVIYTSNLSVLVDVLKSNSK